MSNISLLPRYEFSQGVGKDEDWRLTFAILASDGVTPVDLTGITFSAKVGRFDPITATGDASGTISFSVLAAEKPTWYAGSYVLSIVANDGTETRDVSAGSTLDTYSSRPLTVTSVDDVGVGSTRISVTVDIAVIFANLPHEINGVVPVGTGKPYINSSGYVVTAQ